MIPTSNMIKKRFIRNNNTAAGPPTSAMNRLATASANVARVTSNAESSLGSIFVGSGEMESSDRMKNLRELSNAAQLQKRTANAYSTNSSIPRDDTASESESSARLKMLRDL